MDLKPMNLYNVCRTCLRSDAQLYSLFETQIQIEIANLHLQMTPIDFLKQFTNLSITEENRHPDRICSECLTEIRRFTDFRLRCEKSEMILKELIKRPTAIKQEVYEVIEIDSDEDPLEIKEEIIVKNEAVSNETPIENIAFEEYSIGNNIAVDSNSLDDNYETIVDDDYDEDLLEPVKATNPPPRMEHLNKSRPNQPLSNKLSDQAILKILKCVECNYECVARDCFKNHIKSVHFIGTCCKICDEVIDPRSVNHHIKHLFLSYSLESVFELTNHGICHCTPKVHVLGKQCPEPGESYDIGKCESCSEVLDNNDVLQRALDDPNASLECEICSLKYKEITALFEHIQAHISVDQFACQLCKKTFSRKDHLKLHTRSHTGEKPWKCELCPKSYSQKNCLFYHLARIHPESNKVQNYYECNVCLRKFWYKSYYVNHLRVHEREKTANFLDCKYCGKLYGRPESLDQHIKFAHPEVDGGEVIGTHKCEICGKLMLSEELLTGHLAEHISKRSCRCEFCEKFFDSHENLFSHMNEIHINEGPFKCTTCSTELNQLDVYLEHRKTEHPEIVDEEFFDCECCPEKFRTTDDLFDHLRAHNMTGSEFNQLGTQPSSTSSSDSANILKSELVEPVKLMQKKDVYKCGVCTEGFAQKSDLFAHYRIHVQYRCDICEKDFQYKASYESHMRRLHGVQVNDN